MEFLMSCLSSNAQSCHSTCVEKSNTQYEAETPAATVDAAGKLKDLRQTLRRSPAHAPEDIFHLNHRWTVHVDGEYQQFTFGAMSSGGLRFQRPPRPVHDPKGNEGSVVWISTWFCRAGSLQ
jgi:hypothetical protein